MQSAYLRRKNSACLGRGVVKHNKRALPLPGSVLNREAFLCSTLCSLLSLGVTCACNDVCFGRRVGLRGGGQESLSVGDGSLLSGRLSRLPIFAIFESPAVGMKG